MNHEENISTVDADRGVVRLEQREVVLVWMGFLEECSLT